ncbi:PqqD family peptide modification chaperone [Paenibacillus methanolicus]|uniref:Coenzyme PQQ synthesis protein D (PqqD) n=1 Tax=Paenibacillus methanolicus TaxID=582686 RepID=A0A5S5BPU0_9BACL|nr:PqqD family peptide modification chaperone [Paenibacillus methanolicus]TYP69139.1 coenzyme PQQ synthesis protein D (PqqD) [Paenibacillus methanolicus]
MLDIQSGKYYALEGVSADIWRIIEVAISMDTLVNRLLEIYDIDKHTCLEQTSQFLTRMKDLNLIAINA